ncbi:hypothetical protein ACYA8F_26270 [Klebsiella pneumoniae]|uniref:hypothetical protein n=1 Tax=Klebsiella/Raoultella group TaxID=2890311 RepID=UPI0005387D62|nr:MULTISPECIES: hypothetical protein [Klebsiella/Raoultella group]RAZ96087.1 hypothetical protein DK853_26600 [Klebsiella oxytoca]ELJ6259146.1 hypothetical protein [Klebsiella michiganensis]MBX4673390.1 hypothetical protein [Klebsiella sp. CVUAS 5466.2]MBX8656891.1 hypothetical protein [Klebsiella michiganensis]MBZ1747096.1 hypothetical protein [Klebsiella pneumoniae]
MDILTWPLSQTVTDIASLTGIVSFFFTVKVFFTTRSLKAALKSKVRIPQIHSDLQKKASMISEAIGEWDNRKDFIRKEFTDCAVFAESLLDKLSSKDRAKIDIFLDDVKPKKLFRRKEIVININDQEQAWKLYEKLSILNSRVNELVKDMQLD